MTTSGAERTALAVESTRPDPLRDLDGSLARRHLEGNPQAFRILVDRYQRRWTAIRDGCSPLSPHHRGSGARISCRRSSFGSSAPVRPEQDPAPSALESMQLGDHAGMTALTKEGEG